MRWIFLAAFALFAACSSGDTSPTGRNESARHKSFTVSDPFPDATEVRLFVESGERRKGQAVFTKSDGQALTQEQRKVLEEAISIKKIEEDQSFAACFIPSHFFRYFDAKGKQIGEISVCFCCADISIIADNPSSNLEIDEDHYLDFDYPGLTKLVQSMGEPTDIECIDEE